MPTTKSLTVVCLNPNTGRRMNIEKTTYDLFSKAIYHVVKSGKAITFTQIVEGEKDCFKKDKINFKVVIEWYAIK